MRILLIFAGLALSLAAASQEIYRWVDKNGVVHYSDQPDSPDAVLIDVIEPNAYEAQDALAAANADRYDSGSRRDEQEESRYTSLAIVSPTPDQVFFGADAVVSVAAELQGTLQPDHTVAFFLNGERRETEGLTAQFPGLPRGSYVLRASILDADGRPVITSPQVSFHVRQPSINSPQSPTAPPKPAPPKPTPRPRTNSG